MAGSRHQRSLPFAGLTGPGSFPSVPREDIRDMFRCHISIEIIVNMDHRGHATSPKTPCDLNGEHVIPGRLRVFSESGLSRKTKKRLQGFEDLLCTLDMTGCSHADRDHMFSNRVETEERVKRDQTVQP